ncbi:hypothetical protein ACIBG8_12080 [Nonomuraea sp. NPDC050556]|uniref:hypothetical protein n=1 Tax=Nonomuraea sp. NPDC050556 TaxID=3364369 RepID=UPI0037A907FE
MPGTLVLMGSGETSPTMVEVHRAAVRQLGARPRAVLLDTPYAFQENAADISARARRYFARSVGLEVAVGVDIVGADWVFSGPGSPTFALDRWTSTSAGGDLRARVRARAGVTVLASAAACTAGLATVPVYEIYKVGAEPHWREGLDLLGVLGLRVVVIPHYDNAEGGTHDTRFCYLGERRLARMEEELPPDAAVLGIDEHTALVVDLVSGEVLVSGRGWVTVRRRGAQTVLPAGARSTVASLASTIVELGSSRVALSSSGAGSDAGSGVPGVSGVSGGEHGGGGGGGSGVGDGALAASSASSTSVGPFAGRTAGPATLAETARDCVGRFEKALAAQDPASAALAVLDLEEEVTRWSADTEEDAGGVDEAREILRHQIAQLGGQRRDEGLGKVVEALLSLRGELRRTGEYGAADGIRAALHVGGVCVEDTPDGTRWEPCP